MHQAYRLRSRTVHRSRRRQLVAAIATLFLFALASQASAASFTVNSTGDGADANPGDGICATSPANGGGCTLRAAVGEANALGGSNTIGFVSSFDGSNAHATIALASALPPITSPLTIDGGNCGTATNSKPCVGLQASSQAFAVNASNVTIRGLAIDGPGNLILVAGPITGLVVKGDWFGLQLDGTAQGSPYEELEIGGDVSGALIGGTQPADRNLFVGGHTGLQVYGKGTTIQGNWFGLAADGTKALPPLYAIQLGLALAGFPTPDNTLIGGPDSGTPGVCDGPCNMIEGSAIGINLDSKILASGRSMVTNTMIQGNFIGIGANDENYGNQIGIFTGLSDNTTVGGPTPDYRNYISANQTGVQSTGGSTNISQNYFGLNRAGTGALPNRLDDISATNGQITNNAFGASPSLPTGPALTLGNAVTVKSNTIGVGAGGEKLGYTPPAISIAGNGNVVGGDAYSDENVIANGAGNAIEITSGSSNEVLGNRGSNNLGVMLDLIPPQGPGNASNGPNSGIQAPHLASATTTSVAGTADAYTTVRVYKVAPGSFSLIGQGGTQGDGSFSFGGLNGLADGDCVAVTETLFATSELSNAVPVTTGPCDLVPPNTTITAGPGGTPLPVNSAAPGIGGTAQVGKVLAEQAGAWTNSPTSVSYQWRRCDQNGNNCSDISGATSTTYTPVAGDAGATIRVVEIASNAGGAGNPATSAPTASVAAAPSPPPAVPSITSLPSIAGVAQVGQVLAEQAGTWTNNPTGFAYQWRRCDQSGNSCADIAGATATNYTLVSADAGSTIRVVETASNAGGAGTPATSAPTAVVTAPAPNTPVNLAPPTIFGTAQVGQTLVEQNGSWTNSPTSLVHQWRRCDVNGASCVDIAGATQQFYFVTTADGGSTIRVTEIASNAGGPGSPATSAQTAVVPGPTGGSRLDRRGPIATSAAAKPRSRAQATFRFRSSKRLGRFQCRVDARPWRRCSGKSSDVVRGLPVGHHVFSVRAIDRAGNVDPTPARRRFAVHKPRRHRSTPRARKAASTQRLPGHSLIF